MKEFFRNRIKYEGDIRDLIEIALGLYSIGSLVEFKVIEVGYEDFNVRVESSKGLYFFKFFAQAGAFAKSSKDAKDYVNKLIEASKTGIKMPKLIKNKKDEILSCIEASRQKYYFIVEKYIESVKEIKLTKSDYESAGKSLAKLNTSKFKPPYYYDEWAIANFCKEYERKKKYLEEPDKKRLEPIYKKFKGIDLSKLPHSFVHGDVLRSNVLKSAKSQLYFIDFSVAHFAPRIIDLAVVASEFVFYPEDIEKSVESFDALLNSYNKINKLDEQERKLLPLLIEVCAAMYVLLASYEIANREEFFDEDYYWRDIGRSCLDTKYYMKVKLLSL